MSISGVHRVNTIKKKESSTIFPFITHFEKMNVHMYKGDIYPVKDSDPKRSRIPNTEIFIWIRNFVQGVLVLKNKYKDKRGALIYELSRMLN